MFNRHGWLLGAQEKPLYVLKEPHERSCAFHFYNGRLRLYPDYDAADRLKIRDLDEGVVHEVITVQCRLLEVKRVRKRDGADYVYARQLMMRSGVPGDVACDHQCYYRQFYARKCRHSVVRSEGFETWRY